MLNKLESVLMPLAEKIGKNKYLIAIRDGFLLSMPLLIVGSFFPVSYTHLDVYKRQVSASGLYLPDIGNGLGKDMVLSGYGDNRHIVVNQGNGSVL